MDNLEKASQGKFDTSLYCIREKKSDKILGVSFSPKGLEYIANKTGRILLFRNARFAVKNNKLEVVGDTTKDERLYIVKYSKINHMERYQRMKESGQYDNKTLDHVYRTAKIMNSYEDFWEKSIAMKINYYNYIFKTNSNEVS